MNINYDINASEQANIRATLEYLTANPQYIGVTAPPPGYGWVPADPRFQPRLVMEQQTYDLYAHLCTQFGIAPAPKPGTTPPVGTEPFPDGALDFGNIALSSNTPWIEIAKGQLGTAVVLADGDVSFTVQAGSGVSLWLSTDQSFPGDESKTAYGSGATDNLFVRQGQRVYVKMTGGAEKSLARIGLVIAQAR